MTQGERTHLGWAALLAFGRGVALFFFFFSLCTYGFWTLVPVFGSWVFLIGGEGGGLAEGRGCFTCSCVDKCS